jgi:putative transcriptional regulator
MILITLKHAIFKRQIAIGKVITIIEISNSTGISRTTLHRMIKDPSYNTSTVQMGKICEFLKCDISDLLTIVI